MSCEGDVPAYEHYMDEKDDRHDDEAKGDDVDAEIAADDEEDGDGCSEDGEDEEEADVAGEEDECEADCIRLVPSLVEGRPPTVFFPYPEGLNLPPRDCAYTTVPRSDLRLRFRCYWERRCIKNAFARAGFERTKGRFYNVAWFKHPSQDGFRRLGSRQRVNHFPGSWAIGRKDRLMRSINSCRSRFGSQHFNFLPECFQLPGDRDALTRMLRAKRCLMILKPRASSCGRGIKLITRDSLPSIPAKKKCIVQKYVANPYLIGGKKFDLRLYVLVSSVDPLCIHLFPEGLTRFCTQPYSLNAADIKNRYMHLTNYSINKKSADFEQNAGTTAAEQACGRVGESKWSLTALWEFLHDAGADVAKIKARIKDLIIKTVISAEGEMVQLLHRLVRQPKGVCYELFGFDVMLDDKLKPWLIEVNISPSLMGSSPLDQKIKGTMMADIFHLIGISAVDVKKQTEAPNHSGGSSSLTRRASRTTRQTAKSVASGGLRSLDAAGWSIVHDYNDELNRRGHFECIFPTALNVNEYARFLQPPRYANEVLRLYLQHQQKLSAASRTRKVSGTVGDAKVGQAAVVRGRNTRAIDCRPRQNTVHGGARRSSCSSPVPPSALQKHACAANFKASFLPSLKQRPIKPRRSTAGSQGGSTASSYAMYDPGRTHAGSGKSSKCVKQDTTGSGRGLSHGRHRGNSGNAIRVGVSAARERGASARARITAAIACVSPEATAGRGIF